MAATRLVLGVLREFWQELVPQGPGAATVATNIRITAGQLCRVQGLLTIVTPTGSPVFTAVPSIVNRRLVVTVTNTAGGGNLATWTLDVRLIQSSDQANQGATPKSLGTTGYIQVANGATSSLAGPQTLAQTYAIGASDTDQRMIVTTLKGGGVTIDTTDAGVTAHSVSLEIRQNAAWSLPTVIGRRGDIVDGPKLTFDRARGTYPAPTDNVLGDEFGSIDFTGYATTSVVFNRIISSCVSAPGGLIAVLDFHSAYLGTLPQVVRMSALAAGAVLTCYGTTPIVRPNASGTGDLGASFAVWNRLYVNTANVYANVCLGGVTPGVNAHHTVVLPIANTVPPGASAGLVHVYAQDFVGTPCSPPFGAALAWTSEAEVMNAVQVANRLIPVVVNGQQLLLLAINLNPV